MNFHRKKCRGVEFEVRISDQVVGRHRIAVDPDEPDAWIPWTVDLSAFENQWVRLDLRVRPLGLRDSEIGVRREPAIWAEPTIIDYPTKKLSATASRGTLPDALDENRDGYLSPQEIRARILELADQDEDSFLTPVEEPPHLPGLFAAMDADGDGKVDSAEIWAFDDEMYLWLR